LRDRACGRAAAGFSCLRKNRKKQENTGDNTAMRFQKGESEIRPDGAFVCVRWKRPGES
jgi:hypothetical protein